MGDRGQVFVKDTGVYLYTHWSASGLIDIVRRALAKKWRWNDPEYLTRIIFDEMIGKGQGEETGFGIGTKIHGDVWRVIEVNCKDQVVILKDEEEDKVLSFKDFIEGDKK